MTFLKIAWRNLIKRPIHTAILMMAIIAGTFTLVLFLALSQGFFVLMVNTIVDSYMGHIQIHKKDYLLKRDVKMLVPHSEKILEVISKNPHITGCSPRIVCQGLVSSAEKTMSGIVYGIDPKKESTISDIQSKVTKGKILEADDIRGIFIGEALAEKLKVDIGEKVVVMAQDTGGEMNSALFRVRGMFKSGSKDFDKANSYITIKGAKQLLGIENNYHEIAIRLDKNENVPLIKSFLQEKLYNNDEIRNNGIVVESWKDLSPMLAQQIDMFEGVKYIWFFIIYTALAFGIINAFFMEIFDRIKEFGIMMSLGTSPFRIFLMLMLESLLLGLIGSALGIVISFVVINFILGNSISFGSGMEYMGISNDIPLIVTAKAAWGCFFWTAVAVVASTLYPAIRAAMFRPVEAMRHV